MAEGAAAAGKEGARTNVRKMDRSAHRAATRATWQRRAEAASDAFGLVLALVLLTFVLSSLLDNRGWEAVVISVSTGATSVVALVSSHSRRGLVRGALWLAVLTVALATLAAATGANGFYYVGSCIQISLLAFSMAAVLRRVIATATVSPRTILGALSVYAVFGMVFTFLYGLVDRLGSGPFFEGVPNPAGSDFLFFSYTTLTTTGYGNLVPAGEFGRMVSVLEMLVGQVFLVTLVAGLVSLWSPGQGLRRGRAERAESS